ncbi:TIGR03086 family metal-binding protein [Actinomadura fibrosa]|uniref:TIGR03086 family metal-binding protein n=1 Tax=Actinomadura fibrosa TaxID=111802 RepID=A0ABW2Y3A9_9ACTN|nr:TIGR03086 family metal-binding protein [Actinomadura fibrosa]
MGVSLLQRAIGHALDCVDGISRSSLLRATPCAGWNVRTLLHHMNDAFDVLEESAYAGFVAPGRARTRQSDDDPVASIRRRAMGILHAGLPVTRGDTAAIGDRRIPVDGVMVAMALEIAVHGWDIARACGDDRPIPAGLSAELLLVVPLLVDDATRPGLFAPRVTAPDGASPSDRLVAYLGRDPTASRWAGTDL